MSARVLSQHERRVLVQSHQLGVHDLVRLLVLQDAVLIARGHAVGPREGDRGVNTGGNAKHGTPAQAETATDARRLHGAVSKTP